MNLGIFDQYLWENRLKYHDLVQRLFLLLNLSVEFPATLNIEPTNVCNLKCVFCPTKNTNRPFDFIKMKLYQKIIDQISKTKKLKVLWLNKDGEPLLHPEIDKLAAYAKNKKVANRIEMYSNGILLNQTMAKKLIKAGLDSLVISLDATNKVSFKKEKGKDAYGQIVKNINRFLKIRKKLNVKRPMLSVKMLDLGKKSEIKKFKQLWKNKADSVIIQKLHNWEGSIKVQGSRFKVQGSRRYPCNLPWLAPAVNWDGTIVPCCINYKKNELIMGDLKKQTLTEIWQGDNFKKLRQAHLKQDFSQFPTCARCQFWQQLPNMGFWLKRIGI